MSPLNPTIATSRRRAIPVTFPAYADEAGQAAARAPGRAAVPRRHGALGFTDTDGNGILNVPNTPEAQAFDPEGAGQDWSPATLRPRQDDEEDKLAAELIEAWFKAAGVDIDFEPVTEDPQLYDGHLPIASPTPTWTCTSGAGAPIPTRTSS